MPSEDLGPRPEPQIEPGEPNPGGVDAIDTDPVELATPDLPVDKNPAVDGGDTDDAGAAAVKEDMSSGEDTSTQATESTGGSDEEPMSGEHESPA